MSLRYALSPSGGIAYHLIAYRRARSLWRPFRAVVHDWLSSWLTTTDRELIVFGPSAGWTLPLENFERFSRLTFVEPDPIARFLLRRRLQAAGIRESSFELIARADLLPWFSIDLSTFETFLRERPNAVILFANVLGQVSLHLSAQQRARVSEARNAFFKALRGRRWASYHDLLSGSSNDLRGLKSEVLLSPVATVAQHVFATGDVIDHETDWLSVGRKTKLGLWPLTEKSVHLIGFVQDS